jgi:hypothetical protein
MPDAEPRRGGGWNYRICREMIDGDFFFSLREVYYDEDGNPNGWTAEPVDFAGDTWKDVAEGISLASGSIGTAILDLDTREWIKPGPKSSRVTSPARGRA